MTYILHKDLPDPQSLLYREKSKNAWKQYKGHLDTWAKRLPPKALAFARADWHYNHEDHRCPHDAWLQSVRVEEGPGSSPAHERSIRIFVDLLGAFHDGHLQIVYENIIAYSFDMPSPGRQADRRTHHDWLTDEIRSEGHQGRAIHEIEWASGAHWIIDCCEIEATWYPLPESGEAEAVSG